MELTHAEALEIMRSIAKLQAELNSAYQGLSTLPHDHPAVVADMRAQDAVGILSERLFPVVPA